jgi:hypothetical protein
MVTKIPRPPSELEETLALQLRAARIGFTRQFRFHPHRQWRFDFVLSHQIAVECQGGIWRHMGHSTGVGISGDCVKYCHAAMMGWRVMPVTLQQVKSGKALHWIKGALSAAEN